MFQGSMVALVTPMHPDNSIDYDALARLVEFHVEAGTDAIVAVGTTGESATLDEQEHCDVVQRVVKLAAGRIPIIAGTGSNSTQEAIELTRCAQQAGADACLLVTPYYNKPTQEGLYQHFHKIAESVDIPQILYNVPGRTAVDMLPETVERLARISNIIGIKEATGDLERGQDILRRCEPGFALYSGDDATAMALILAGAQGDISVTANVAPQAMHEMCAAALTGNRDTATAINDRLMVLHQDLFVEANPIPVKWALYRMGMIESGIRLPLTMLSEQGQARVSQALIQAGIL
jgi:4-hydroxy-tetrahydrodipicolinate synthase